MAVMVLVTHAIKAVKLNTRRLKLHEPFLIFIIYYFLYYSVASCPIANQAHVNEDCVTEEILPNAKKQVYSKLSMSNIKLILKLY